MQTPQWRAIPGYEGFYEVSDDGQIRSLDRIVRHWTGSEKKHRGRVLRQDVAKNGYLRVMLSKHGKTSRFSVHRLVLEAFVGPCPPGMLTRHMNGNRTDNRLSNLQWGTPSENAYDRVRHNRNEAKFRTHCPRGHKLEEPNLMAAHARKGHRNCLACSRARSYIRAYPDTGTLQEVSDRYYSAIIGDTGTA